MAIESINIDPADLYSQFEAIESGEESAEEKAPKEEPAPEKEEEPKVPEDIPEAEPEGIATKDGKHVIPYSVLKSERVRASRAEQLAKDAQARLAEMEARLQGSQGAVHGESARTGQEEPLLDEDLAGLEEDFPTVFKAIQAMQARTALLESKLQPVAQSVRNQEAEQARSEAERVQDAIDAVPVLASFQANNAEAFALAKQFDSALKELPDWSGKPLAERFAKVAEMVEAVMGPVDLPGNAKPASQSAEELKRAALAKADASAKAKSIPTSLSEFPAGRHAAQDEREAVDQMSHLQLAEKMWQMTPDEMDAYFQNL